ncbi:unnamed protein product [Anisakis simplex]|uniref:2-Hacid_dh domain-containing protein n=1 Tax=Anisakis simplex TaxID=6269 RepID=A0A0M3K4L7_ANISI|nr:unnamed protein product [Anisakis simplex]
MIHINSVLIADEIEQGCIDALDKGGVKAVKKTKLPKDQLIAELKNHDAVIVRSATKITREVIEALSGKLKLIGRAGTGVDNIDVKAATEHGVIVMNTPGTGQDSGEKYDDSVDGERMRKRRQDGSDEQQPSSMWGRPHGDRGDIPLVRSFHPNQQFIQMPTTIIHQRPISST